jgi:hypothetical protein
MLILTVVMVLSACGQTRQINLTGKSSKNMNAMIINEYWSYSTQMPLGGYAVNFTQFTFYETGTFEHRFGYSGGVYIENCIRGSY